MYVYIFFSLIILTDFFVADVISTVEFNQTGDLLATGDKGGRVVIFQRETEVGQTVSKSLQWWIDDWGTAQWTELEQFDSGGGKEQRS